MENNFTDAYYLVFVQDNWDPDWQSTSSSKVSYIVQKLKALQEANIEVGHHKDDDSDAKHIEELPFNSQMTSSEGLIQDVDRSTLSSKTHEIFMDKVLIFSQFLEHIHVIEQQVIYLYSSSFLYDYMLLF